MFNYRTEYNVILNRSIHYTPTNFPVRVKSSIDKIIESQLWQYPNAIIEFKQYCMKVGLNYKLLNIFYNNIVSKYNITNKLSNERGVNRMKSIERYIKIDFPVSCYLDIGCLDGGITESIGKYFRLNKLQTHGVDVKSYENAGENNYDNITFTTYDGSKLPYTDDSFDLVTCLMVFHHIQECNITILIEEIYRILKPNGILILREHDAHTENDKKLLNLMHDFYDYVWLKKSDNDYIVCEENWDINYHTNDSLNYLFESIGFNIHTPANIYKSEKNPFMTYMCSYQKPGIEYKSKNIYRILPSEMKRMKYYRRTKEIKNVIHWGQRKLLLSEIEFLTLYLTDQESKKESKKEIYVIYAGSAPGTHILYLSQLFPQIHFELYDPREFSNKLKKSNMINTYVQYFTNETANLWKPEDHLDKNLLFISDIRTGDTETMEFDEIEERVKIDHQWQMNWYNIIKPKLSMFKFRLPYNSDAKTEYLDGEIYIQAYSPATSTETRLIVKENAKMKTYDNHIFEEQMFYFNTKERSLYYNNILYELQQSVKYGIRNNYDGAVEVCILERYILYNNSTIKLTTLRKQLCQMINNISQELSQTRNLLSEQPIKEKKRKELKRLKKDGFIPPHSKLNQTTFNIYIIPRYDYFKNLGYLDDW
jgi:ubiquinone/menaquinone biosynthesis C-methylase UbiE